MIEPREDEECATCAGFYESLTERRGVRVRLDREDRYFCQVCARLIAAAWQAAQGGGGDAMSTAREGPHWVYDACDQGHDYERYGDDIAWEMCARCGHCRYTRAHRVAVAREQAEKERAG